MREECEGDVAEASRSQFEVVSVGVGNTWLELCHDRSTEITNNWAWLCLQDLESMREALEAEFGKDLDDSDSNSSDSQAADDLFCPACNKMFRSSKA